MISQVKFWSSIHGLNNVKSIGRMIVEEFVLIFIMIHMSDECCCGNNANTNWSYQVASVHRAWYHSFPWEQTWGHDFSKSCFSCPQSAKRKAWSKQNLMGSSPSNIKHSCCDWLAWLTKQPLHSKAMAWSRNQCTWWAKALISCSWTSMVDWPQFYVHFTFLQWWLSIYAFNASCFDILGLETYSHRWRGEVLPQCLQAFWTKLWQMSFGMKFVVRIHCAHVRVWGQI